MHTDWLIDGPPEAHWTLILAHGAGQDMGSDFMTFFAHHLGRAKVRVIRFEFPYMAASSRDGRKRPPDRAPVLLDTWRLVIARVGETGVPMERLAIGGKSLGGRIASLVAEEEGVAALVCLGYPFHPPGKPAELRTAHLATLRVPTLICQGTRDPFGNDAEVGAYRLSRSIQIAWIPDGEHSFKPPERSGRSLQQNLLEAVDQVVRFLDGLRR